MTNFESMSTLHCIHTKEQKAELSLDIIQKQHLSFIIGVPEVFYRIRT